MDAQTFATWALAVATVGLVCATGVLAWYSRLQAKQMEASAKQAKAAALEAARQTAALQEQGELQRSGLLVSGEMLREARAERAANAPLVVAIELREHVAGHAIFYVQNAAPDAVMRVANIRVLSLLDESLYADDELAKGTLGVGEGWPKPLAWNATLVGAVLAVIVTGHRVGGPTMTREFRYRIGQDGRLVDLGAVTPTESAFA